MGESIHLGDLQYRIMRVLWDAGEATVSHVHEELQGDGPRALTTIATMLSKMEKKGVVTHRNAGRQYVYRPTVTESAVHRSMVADLTTKLFQGDVSALVNHLLTEQEIDSGEIARLKTLIAEAEQAAGDSEADADA